MNEKTPQDVHELRDKELKEVVGGVDNKYRQVGNNYYHWTGDFTLGGRGVNERYLCPKCGRKLHLGAWLHFYCDPCDDDWWWEDSLIPNVESRYWVPCSKAEYEKEH